MSAEKGGKPEWLRSQEVTATRPPWPAWLVKITVPSYVRLLIRRPR